MRAKAQPTKEEVVGAIKSAAEALGHPPSRAEFIAHTGIRERQVLSYFDSWNEAVAFAGLEPNTTNVRREPSELLTDWGELARRLCKIPTRIQYAKYGRFSPSILERSFGRWSDMPAAFLEFAQDDHNWSDVVALLSPSGIPSDTQRNVRCIADNDGALKPARQYSPLTKRATYGDPIDFRGLRHEPVNEQGVVFLFGMVARELSYMVEAIQAGFPDCEAKRQVSPGKWQRVFIEFEYESRNFREHGHSSQGCDVIVCWIHNWLDCPDNLEVLELSSVIRLLAR